MRQDRKTFRKPPRRDGNNTSKPAEQGTMKKAAPGNGTASSTNEAGRPPMNNTTTPGAGQRKLPTTIGATQQIATKARKIRAGHNKAVKEIRREKTALKRAFNSNVAKDRALANAEKAAALKNDKKTIARIAQRRDALKKQRIQNARKRSGLTQSENAHTSKAAKASTLIDKTNQHIDGIRQQRATKKAAATNAAPAKEADKEKQRTDNAESAPPSNYKTRGGDELEDDSARPGDITGLYDWSDEVDALAARVLAYFQRATPSRQRQHQWTNNTAKVLQQIEVRGITVNIDGVDIDAIEALATNKISIGKWWIQIKNLFNDTNGEFPYHGQYNLKSGTV